MLLLHDHAMIKSYTRVTLHTTEPICTQPSIAQHTTGQVEDKMAVRERVDSTPKQEDFVHLNVSQEQSLSKHCFYDCETHVGQN